MTVKTCKCREALLVPPLMCVMPRALSLSCAITDASLNLYNIIELIPVCLEQQVSEI